MADALITVVEKFSLGLHGLKREYMRWDMSDVSPAAQIQVLTELLELGYIQIEDMQKFFGIGELKMGEFLPDFNDGEEEVSY